MKVMLIFPPVSDPRGPHLAPAALAAALRHAGHDVTVRDLDVECALYLLSPEVMHEHLARAQETLQSLDVHGKDADWETLAWKHRLFQAVDEAAEQIPHMQEHIEMLRSKSFYEPKRYYAARKAINSALALAAACYDRSLTYKMDGQDFITRYREYRISELLKAVHDSRRNMFESLFRRRIMSEIITERPGMVGISILNYQQIIPGLILARMLKEAGLWVVVGGTVYSKFVDSLERCPEFFTMCSAVVACEGESALVALAAELEANSASPDLGSIPNLIWHDGASVRVNRPFLVEDISRLPTPDYSGFPLERYLAPGCVLPYNLGKGCYWNRCLFCEIPLINNLPGSRYRVKPAQLIVDQLEELSTRFKTPYFQFTDESCHPGLLEQIADIIIARNLTIFYLCYARLEKAFTAPLLAKLRRSGLRNLMFGLESGSDRMLRSMHKGITTAQAEQVLTNCRDADIYFRLFVILGFPGETAEQVQETRSFLHRISPLLRHPFNTFEINLFHLDTFSYYGRNPEEFNITVPDQEHGEFFLGSNRFSCPGSIDRRTLHRYVGQIRDEMYRMTDMGKKHGRWEEYSLLNICNVQL